MRLGIDLDGCVYDFTEALKRTAIKHGVGGLHEGSDFPAPTGWYFYEKWGLTRDEYALLLENYGEDLYSQDLWPMEGSDLGMRLALERGHEIHLVTHRGEKSLGARFGTLRWLADFRVANTSVTFTRDKTIVPVDAFVDDKPENFQDLLDFGVDSYLLDRPWNRHYDCDPNRRVSSVVDFLDRLTSPVLH